MQNHLTDRRLVTLIVRLTLDGQGRLANGEVVDLDGKPIGRFREWSRMTDMVQVWLAGQQGDGKMNSPSALK